MARQGTDEGIDDQFTITITREAAVGLLIIKVVKHRLRVDNGVLRQCVHGLADRTDDREVRWSTSNGGSSLKKWQELKGYEEVSVAIYCGWRLATSFSKKV